MIEWLMQFDFVTRALIAGIGVAIMSGPLGAFMIWRRMSYFGDTLAHSTLLGVSLALLLNINIYIGLVIVCIFVSSILVGLSKQRWLANDAILGLLSHTTLAVGLIIATIIEGVRIDLLSYLYGDILSVNGQDIIWIYFVAVVVIILFSSMWRWFLSATIHEALAKVEGVPVDLVRWAFVLMLAFVFAVAMKLVGVLLITALLVIPPSAARQFAKTPKQMVYFSSCVGCLSVVSGLKASLLWDWPTGPAIVVVAAMLFGIGLVIAKCRSSM